MTSCPGESRLIRLIDGDLTSSEEAVAVDHLAACDECRALLGRSEAALRYALGGIADAERAPASAAAAPAPRRPARFRVAALAAAMLASATVAGVTWKTVQHARRPARAVPTICVLPAVTPEMMREVRLDALIQQAESLTVRETSRLSEERDLLALGALAAAETRGDVLGAAPERAGLRNVVAMYPGTSAARVAAARLAEGAEPR